MFICSLLQTWSIKTTILNIHLWQKRLTLAFSVWRPLAVFIFYLSRCHKNTILHLHSAFGAIVGSIQFAIFTELSQNLSRFHGVSPHIVTMAKEAKTSDICAMIPIKMTDINTIFLSLHGVATCDTARGSVFAVKTVLKVQFGFSNQIIGSHQVPVIDWDSEGGIHRKCCLNVKGSDPRRCILFNEKKGNGAIRWRNDNLLAEQRIQLFGNIVFFVFNLCLSQFNGNVGISLPVNVSWMKICGLPQTSNKP